MKVNKIGRWAPILCAIIFACAVGTGCAPSPRPRAAEETEEAELSEEETAEECVNNLRQIDAAKEQWALANGKITGDTIFRSDVDSYIEGGGPKCPAGGKYTYGKIGELPKCSLPGHVLED